jgi:hypothetical protein
MFPFKSWRAAVPLLCIWYRVSRWWMQVLEGSLRDELEIVGAGHSEGKLCGSSLSCVVKVFRHQI